MSFKILNKIRLAILGTGRVLHQPLYLATTLTITLLFAVLIFILINSGFYGSLLLSSLPILDKIGVIGLAAKELFTTFYKNTNEMLLVIVSLLQGISLALALYVASQNRQDRKVESSHIELNGIAAVAATLGLGCVPCGTSLILPVVAIFFSGSAAALAADVASGIVLLIALILSAYSIYKTGNIAYMQTEFELYKKDVKEKNSDGKN